MGSYIVGGIIALAVLGVILRKVRDWRRGKYCSCGCDSCAGCKKKK